MRRLSWVLLGCTTFVLPLRSTPVWSTPARAGVSRAGAAPVSTAARTATPAVLVGKVIDVSEGDSVTVSVKMKPIRVQLYGIDCPEKSQLYSDRAQALTTSLALGKTATIYTRGARRAGAVEGRLFIGETCVNDVLLVEGLAWWRMAWRGVAYRIGTGRPGECCVGAAGARDEGWLVE